MDNNTIIYGLIGYPLGHSFSAAFFNKRFHDDGLNAEYRNFEIPDITMFPDIIADTYIKGLNVTLPYKQQVIPFLDKLDATAAEIVAVNVINKTTDSNGKAVLTGYNTDTIGFSRSLQPLLHSWHKKALILGTGGASKAVAYALSKLGIDYCFVSRHASERAITYNDLTAALLEKYTVVVNTTPLGMSPHLDECPDIPYEALGERHICYDLIYNPEETLFLKKAATQHAITKNGAEMLRLQALAAWEIWNS